MKDTAWDGSFYTLVVMLNGATLELIDLEAPHGVGNPYFIRDDITGWQANAIRAMEGD